MKPTASALPRRRFLRRAPALLGLASLIDPLPSQTAMGAGAPRNRDDLEPLLDEMDAKGRQFWSVPRKDAQFLHLLVKVARAKAILEVGTSHGYSAIYMALALEETGGRLTTLEIDSDRHALAKQHAARAGVAARIDFRLGDAHEIIPRLQGPSTWFSSTPTRRARWTTSRSSIRTNCPPAASCSSTIPSARPAPCGTTST